MLNLRRLLNRYRWELWLFIGIPAVSAVFVYFYEWSPAGRDDDLRLLGWGSLIAFVCGALLKGASYRWVCRLGRPTLAVLWRCALATSVVGAVTLFFVNILYPLRATRADDLSVLYKWVILLVLLLVGTSIVRLWFAREASRISLAHAFLLVALTSGVGSSILSVVSRLRLEWDFLSPYDLAVVAGSVVIGVWTTLLSIWALAHFDVLSSESRTRVVVLLLALGAFAATPYVHVVREIEAGDYATAMLVVATLALPTVVFTLIVLGLTYLLRVRQPPEPPTAVTAQEDA